MAPVFDARRALAHPHSSRGASAVRGLARLPIGLFTLALVGSCAFSPRSTSAPPAATAADAAPAAPTEPTNLVEAPSRLAYSANEMVDDGPTVADPTIEGQSVPHPLADWTPEQIEEALLESPEVLGPMSIGSPNAGRLFNAVRMPEDPRWSLVGEPNVWGTQETIDSVIRCIDRVNTLFPDTLPLYVGHISSEHGGPLAPHVSHQAGRDVDLGYYYRSSERWFRRANAQNLDRARTWALVRALITETDVELILIDISLQRLLREYATSVGEDPEWLDDVFGGAGATRRPLIRHARGHATHLHARFYSPLARETARLAFPALLKHGLIEPPKRYVMHRAQRGDTLGKLARRYGTTVREIQRANGLRSTVIIAKRSYRIPQQGPANEPPPVAVPPRRLPPSDDDG